MSSHRVQLAESCVALNNSEHLFPFKSVSNPSSTSLHLAVCVPLITPSTSSHQSDHIEVSASAGHRLDKMHSSNSSVASVPRAIPLTTQGSPAHTSSEQHPPTLSTHPMSTRSKNGIFKPKLDQASIQNSQILPSVFLYFLQKKKEERKMNSVFINLVENPESNIEDSISLVREIIDVKKKELLQHALIDGHCDLPKASKHLHLSCLKVFQMFFNSSNLYDSDTELLQDINKPIYLPVRRNPKPVTVESFHSGPKKKKAAPLSNFNWHFKQTSRKSFAAHQVSLPAS